MGLYKKEVKEETSHEHKKYKTDLDKLYTMVKSMGKLDLGKVSEIFGITEEEAEEWAEILEKDGLIEIFYPAVGTAELRSKTFKKIKTPMNLRKLIIPLIYLAIILSIAGLITGSYFIITNMSSDEPIVSQTNEKTVTNEEITLATAFSGTGSYICQVKTGDIMTKYTIKDNKIKIEGESGTEIIEGELDIPESDEAICSRAQLTEGDFRL